MYVLYIFFIQVKERPLRRPWQLYKLFLSLSAALPTHWWISVHMQVSWKCFCHSAALIDREALLEPDSVIKNKVVASLKLKRIWLQSTDGSLGRTEISQYVKHL